MRKAIMGLLLAATVTSPLAAQDWNRGERRENRQELRQDRREIRQDRQDVRREVRQGDRQGAYAAQRELGQDRREFRQDAREAQRDRFAVQNGTANSWAERQRDLRAEQRDAYRGDRFDNRDRFQNRDRFDNRDRRDWNNDRGRYEWRGQGRWDNRWRDDYRYDWQGWRNQNRNVFRLPRYYAPRGYSYRRWSPGYRIEPFFYGRNYWISDPWRYRLPPAYGDYRWVRYYDDVALVDIRTGLIADILYSFFW